MSLNRPTRRALQLIVASAVGAGLSLVGLLSPTPCQAQGQSSEAAQQAQQAAWDDAAPGPMQPVPFSHAIHAGTYQMDCLYCHTATDRSMVAGMPSVESCMGCHLHFGGDLEGVQILQKHWEQAQPVEWIQIHRLPEHVQFPHHRHVAAGVTCQECHGPVEKLDKLYLVADTKWWPWLLPARKLQMGWCVDCHRTKQVSQDCFACHY